MVGTVFDPYRVYAKEALEEAIGAEPDTEETETSTEARQDPSAEEKPRVDVLTIVVITGICVVAALLAVALMFWRRRKLPAERPEETETDRKTLSPGLVPGETVKKMDLSDTCLLRGGSIHGIGRRNSQQDSFGFSEKSGEFIAVVADGMGGLTDGDRVSQQVVITMLSGFDEEPGQKEPDEILYDLVDRSVSAVNAELGAEGIGRCGSTLVSVYVRGNLLYYISVGDSHIYLWREGALYQLNQDHNYAAVLDEKARRGEISEEEAMFDPQRAALTSYIGMGELELIDRNEEGIPLAPKDRILLMSDGVFGTVRAQELSQIMTLSLEESCRALDVAVQSANRSNQDNYTCILLEVRPFIEA